MHGGGAPAAGGGPSDGPVDVVVGGLAQGRGRAIVFGPPSVVVLATCPAHQMRLYWVAISAWKVAGKFCVWQILIAYLVLLSTVPRVGNPECVIRLQ